MKRVKRWLAVILALLLLTSALPTAALAEGDETAETEEIVSAVTEALVEDEDAAPEEILPETANAPVENETEETEETEEAVPADEIVCSGNGFAITVTTDLSKDGTTDGDGNPYAVFEEDGSFTIPLPASTEFPAGVDFLVEERELRIVFGNETETAEVGGHIFRVRLEEAPEPEAPLDLYVTIDGQRVDLVPDEAALLSMLPLTKKTYDLDLTDFFPSELKAVDISTMLDELKKTYTSMTTTADQVAAWVKYSYIDEDGNQVNRNDDYALVGTDQKLDLANHYRYDSTFWMELIIGTGDPLNDQNTRYIITVQTRGEADSGLLSAEACTAGSPRQKIEIYESSLKRTRYTENGSQRQFCSLYMTVDPKTWSEGQEACLGLSLTEPIEGVTAKVYEGQYETAEALSGAKDITDQIWEQASLSTSGGYQADCSWKSGYQGMPSVTLVLTRESSGKAVLVLPMILYMYGGKMSVSCYQSAIYKDNGSSREDIRKSSSSDYRDYEKYTVTLVPGNPANGQYYIALRMNNPADTKYDPADPCRLKYVDKAVVGDYSNKDDIPASAEDIKAKLFSDAGGTGGFKADYSNGVIFTVVDTNGGVNRISIKTVEGEEELPNAPTPLSDDTYFRMNSAKQNNAALQAYVMPYNADSYYFNGFQTVLLLDNDGKPVAEDSEIAPVFYSGPKVDVRLGHNNQDGSVSGGEKQTSEISALPFKNNVAQLYSAAAENGKGLKNYWVTFLTQQTGAKLFVNGINDDTRKDKEREVFLTSDYNYHHDIFFANIGDTELTGLKVELLDAQNVRLDDYWTIQEDGTKTLAPFTKTSYNDELPNVSKIRLMPMEKDGVVLSGAVSGTLVIHSDNGGEERIKLKGTAGTPKIVTDTLPQGVKYVHYSSLLQTNSMYGTDALTFSLAAGSKLPAGLRLKPNGEIYGVPTVSGTYKFTVTAAFTGKVNATDSKEFTLELQTNSDEYVDWANQPENQGYPIKKRMEDVTGTAADRVFISEGEFDQFMNVYLDGRKLTEGTDYTAESGSTAITVRAQTFNSAGNGTHSISTEFREGGSEIGTMHRTAQNFTISGLGSSGNVSSGSSSSNDDDDDTPVVGIKPGDKTPSKPTTQPETNPTIKPTVAEVMKDIDVNQWFFSDVDWAYQKGLMVGVSGDTYLPYAPITPATVVVILSRLNGADLTPWKETAAEGVAPGEWYSPAASWAKNSGLLTEEAFVVTPTMTRGRMALLLVKYLRYLGIDCTLPAKPVAFTDAALMTDEENAAFQVLYQFGIFKGIGNYTMNVSGPTTRAQFAALLHRLSVFVGE